MSLLVAFACGKASDAPPPGTKGAQAPDYAAQTLDDRPATLASLKGKVVLLNLWATWCGPCKAEIPEVETLHRTFADSGLRVVGVSIDAAGSGIDVRDFMRDNNMTYEVWLDPNNDFALKFHTVGVPQTILLDRSGVVRWRGIGALVAGDTTLSAAIRAALAP